MASGGDTKGKAIFGGKWKDKLIHLHYEKETVIHRHEYSKLKHVVKDTGPYPIPYFSPLKSKILKIKAFQTNLNIAFNLRQLKRISKHHFVEMETECGFVFTIEKLKQYILLQSCRASGPDGVPVVRTHRDGEKRCNSEAIESIHYDGTLRRRSDVKNLDGRCQNIFQILEWMYANETIHEPYHVTDSNCQDFARQVWGELSTKTYPNAYQTVRRPKRAPSAVSADTIHNFNIISSEPAAVEADRRTVPRFESYTATPEAQNRPKTRSKSMPSTDNVERRQRPTLQQREQATESTNQYLRADSYLIATAATDLNDDNILTTDRQEDPQPTSSTASARHVTDDTSASTSNSQDTLPDRPSSVDPFMDSGSGHRDKKPRKFGRKQNVDRGWYYVPIKKAALLHGIGISPS